MTQTPLVSTQKPNHNFLKSWPIVILILFVGLTVLALLRLASLRSQPAATATKSDKLLVTTSFYPVYFLVTRIGGAEIDARLITPAGAEPHEYEPTPQDIALLTDSDLIVLLGGGLEPWADVVSESVPTLRVANGLMSIEAEENGQVYPDPHTWLDPKLMINSASQIANELQARVPEHASTFATNMTLLESELLQLDADFASGLANCQKQTVVTSHAALGYLAARYDFTQLAIQGLSPDEDPSPQQLAKLAALVKQQQIEYILFESLVSPRLAETLAAETDTQTALFNPLEGLTPAEVEAGADYFSVQRDNLQTLSVALECE